MEEYTVSKDVEITYRYGKEVKKKSGNLIAGDGGPLGTFCKIDTGDKNIFCINWADVITMDMAIPEMFLNKVSDIKRHYERSQIEHDMSFVEFEQRMLSENKEDNGFQ